MVADVQFCSLGVALLATLAEVFNVVQINKGQLSSIARELGDEKAPETTPRSASNATVDEDFGEVIRRSEVESHIKTTVDSTVSTDGEAVMKKKKKPCLDKSMKRKVDYDIAMTASLGEPNSSKEKKKKKKRKVNAIDDIFAGL